MRTATLIGCLIFPLIPGSAFQSVSLNRYWIKFDEYSNISWKQEIKRLDNFIFQLRSMENVKAYLVVYGGRRSCPDEARLRAERVKNYIVRSGALPEERITILDVGYREEWSIALGIGYVGNVELTKKLVQETEASISETEVKILKQCEKALSEKR